MKTTYPWISAVLALLLVSLACTFGKSAPNYQADAATAVAMTLTSVAIQNPAAAPGIQPAPPSQPAQAAQPTQASQPTIPSSAVPPSAVPPTTVSIPCDRAKFVSETVKDGAKMQPGQVFNKTWTLSNNGSCSWDSAYAVVFDHGDQMGVFPATNFTAAPIAPGQSVDVTVTLTAPTKPGTYQGYFMLKNASGKKFGIGNNADQAFWVKIVVEAAAGPVVHKSGLLEIPQTWTVDLDSGTVGPASGADIHYEVDINASHNLVFLGPAKQMSKQPSYDDCSNAQMDSPTLPISGLSLGTYFCYLTDQGRLGYLEYAGSDTTPGAGKLYLEFTTWKNP
ncbi:MAG: NBR1-Ig-like domain-containing protein [Chloroflexota bacterium]